MKEGNVREIIDEVIGDVCDNYCKYPIIYKPDHLNSLDDDYMGRMFKEKCTNCPLKRLV